MVSSVVGAISGGADGLHRWRGVDDECAVAGEGIAAGEASVRAALLPTLSWMVAPLRASEVVAV